MTELSGQAGAAALQATGDRAATRCRVVVVVPRLGVGGTERHLLEVLPAIDRRRFDVRVVATRGEGPLDDALRGQGVPVQYATTRRGRVTSLLAALLRLPFLLRRLAPDVVHFYLPEAYLVGGVSAWLAGVGPRVMSRRSLNVYHRRRRFSRHAERWLHKRMAAALANSRAVAEELQAEGVAGERLHLVYSGIDIDRIGGESREQARGRLGLAPDALAIVCIANLITYKGHRDLIEAISLAVPELSQPWRLLLAGRDDGIGAALKDYAASLGVAEHIDWLGPRDDVPSLLAASDIAVLASHEEGLPKSILEAMAAGLPTVVTRVGGSPELVVHGTTGLVVEPRDPPALAAAIGMLANDAARRTRMGAAGRARVGESFRLADCVAAYEKIYADLASSRRQANDAAERLA